MRNHLSILFLSIIFVFLIIGCEKKQDEQMSKESAVTGTNDAELIADIQKYRAEGEKMLTENKFTRKVVDLTGADIKESIKQKWVKLDAYYDGDKLVRIQLYPHTDISQRTEEFYLKDGKLVFAFIQDKGPKNEGMDTGEPGKEFYYNNGKLLKYEDTSNEMETDIAKEKEMYEVRLPYEVEELVQIINKN